MDFNSIATPRTSNLNKFTLNSNTLAYAGN